MIFYKSFHELKYLGRLSNLCDSNENDCLPFWRNHVEWQQNDSSTFKERGSCVFAFHFTEKLHFAEIQSAFCLYLNSGLDFLTKFWSSDLHVYRDILTLLYLKYERFTHAQIEITRFDILLIKLPAWYEAETYIADTLCLMKFW